MTSIGLLFSRLSLLLIGFATLTPGEVTEKDDGNVEVASVSEESMDNSNGVNISVAKDLLNGIEYSRGNAICGKRFHEQRFDQSKARGGIVNGVNAVRGAFPWQVRRVKE